VTPPTDLHIGEAGGSDLDDVLAVERAAFGSEAEADLVRALLDDPTAEPRLSLLARDGVRPVGHVLFTSVRLGGRAEQEPMAILAPLAVVPDAQGQGIGRALIEHGLSLLERSGVGLVFVLGHPGYYPRHGFEPAGRLGFDAPFPILEANADAWMVRALRPGLVGTVSGTLRCADALNEPELWQE
jgi:putative acetyltransferase